MATSSAEDQMKMMLEDFNKLQMQLIDLRTENYDVETKLRRSEAENASFHEKCAHQEKEIQKLNKLMKFPGFQAITKSKSKKDMVELIEENDRLSQQMQRHEDDFKLQNQTLLGEVSRLSSENDVLQNQLTLMKTISENVDKYPRLEAENVAATELKQKSTLLNDSIDGDKSSDSNNTYSMIDDIQKKLISELLVIVNTNSSTNGEKIHTNNSLGIQNNDGELTETEGCNNSANENNYEKDIDLKNILVKYFNELKSSLRVPVTLEESHEENNLEAIHESDKLRQQLSSVKESSKIEVHQLREEVAKWSEKAKKKQESFIKLQEEKEKMYEEYRKEMDALKNSSLKSEENLKNIIQKQDDSLNNSQNDGQKEELLAQLNLLRKANESFQEEMAMWKEKQNAENIAKVMGLEGQLANFEIEKESFVHQIKKLNSINEDQQKHNHGLQKEAEDIRREVEKNSELAERRKCLLDNNALERQQDIEVHQKKLEEIKEWHKKEMEEFVGQKIHEIEDLRNQIASQKKYKKDLEESNKKFKKDLEDSNIGNTRLLERVASLEKRSGWLERTLSEEQEACKNLKATHEQQVMEMTNSFLKEKDEQEIIYQTELQELEKSLKVSKMSQQESELLVDKLKQATKDHEIELTIGKKKNDQLIKDLKRQLTSERKRADQLSVKLQDFIQEVKVKQTYDEIFNPESLQMKMASSHKRQDSGSHISNVSSINENDDLNRSMKTSSPAESTTNLAMPCNLSGLSDETMDLISRYADLQQEKWLLEERVRHLEETGGAMAEDVMQKSLIIQHYVMEQKNGTPPSVRKSLTLKEKMFDKLKQIGTEELVREMNIKMQRILEETLASNVQLQKDMDLLSVECQQLKNPTSS